MQYIKIQYEDLHTESTASILECENCKEYNAVIEIKKEAGKWEEQYTCIQKTKKRLIENVFNKASIVFERYFLSDAYNEARKMDKKGDHSVSVIQQAPLNGNKICVWLYLVDRTETEKSGTEVSFTLKRPHYIHYYDTQIHSEEGNIYEQTLGNFKKYTNKLSERACSLERNCIRTWIYVQDVDFRYKGMVLARNKIFEEENLRKETHFISSTGIEGRNACPKALMTLDAYAIEGIREEQIHFLKALDNLNQTYEYGVAFERGTALCFGDRTHIYLSGTASIDNKGNIVHLRDIEGQVKRTLENIKALLREGGMKMQDIAQLTVYLRDSADYFYVKVYLEKRFPMLPKIILLAAVCRPGWLVEMECTAKSTSGDKRFKNF